MAKKEIHIGKEVRQIITKRGIKLVWLAEQVGCDDSNLNKWLKKEHIYPELLLNISIVLKINFFEHYNRAYSQAMAENEK